MARRRSVGPVNAAGGYDRRVATSRQEWLESFARRLGVATPSEAQCDAILALAGVAAHESERTAAPIACWMAASAGLDAEAALAFARELSGPATD